MKSIHLGGDRDVILVDELRLGGETETVEFKVGTTGPESIGKYISALANAAVLAAQDYGHLIWGVRDDDHEVVGTSFDPAKQQARGQPLKHALSKRIQPGSAFQFREVKHPRGRVVLLEIPAATTNPITFDRIAYIRINGATPKLADHPEKERELWRALESANWEDRLAARSVSADQVLGTIDYGCYFRLTQRPEPKDKSGILEGLAQAGIVVRDLADRWDVTNLGAILFATSLGEFGDRLAGQKVRFASYDGKGRECPVTHRKDEQQGYAMALPKLVEYFGTMLPADEQIDTAVRRSRPMYPEMSVRELLANAMVHQDMTAGTGPAVELFRGRLEIANHGKPLVAPNRFIDAVPRSRNKKMSALMHQMGLVEELGTGIDKVIAETELHCLPPPDFREESDALRAVLFAPRKFSDMTKTERIRACYQHAALMHVRGERTTNSSLRARFGLASAQSSAVSQVIRAAKDRGLNGYADPLEPKLGYVPHWA